MNCKKLLQDTDVRFFAVHEDFLNATNNAFEGCSPRHFLERAIMMMGGTNLYCRALVIVPSSQAKPATVITRRCFLHRRHWHASTVLLLFRRPSGPIKARSDHLEGQNRVGTITAE